MPDLEDIKLAEEQEKIALLESECQKKDNVIARLETIIVRLKEAINNNSDNKSKPEEQFIGEKEPSTTEVGPVSCYSCYS